MGVRFCRRCEPFAVFFPLKDSPGGGYTKACTEDCAVAHTRGLHWGLHRGLTRVWELEERLARGGRGLSETQGNHEVRALQQPPNAAHAERAISKHPPPSLYKVPTYSTRAGAAPHAPGGARHGGGNRAVNSQPRTGQSTSYGDVKSSYRGGGRVGQEGERDMGTQERQQTGGGATQTHRTREPHQEGQGRAQQTRRRGTARQERQPEQREMGTRMERMAERAHGRQRQ